MNFSGSAKRVAVIGAGVRYCCSLIFGVLADFESLISSAMYCFFVNP